MKCATQEKLKAYSAVGYIKIPQKICAILFLRKVGLLFFIFF
jgi:hypothetical protein